VALDCSGGWPLIGRSGLCARCFLFFFWLLLHVPRPLWRLAIAAPALSGDRSLGAQSPSRYSVSGHWPFWFLVALAPCHSGIIYLHYLFYYYAILRPFSGGMVLVPVVSINTFH
jgi:hypothetical protein